MLTAQAFGFALAVIGYWLSASWIVAVATYAFYQVIIAVSNMLFLPLIGSTLERRGVNLANAGSVVVFQSVKWIWALLTVAGLWIVFRI